MQRKLIYILLAVASVAGIWLLLNSLERYEEQVDQGWSQAALRNPFLAAEQFLQAHAVAVRNTDRIDALKNLSVDASIVVQDSSLLSSDRFLEELDAWVSAGGHAIVEAPWYEENFAFELRFGVYKYHDDDEADSQGGGRSASRAQKVGDMTASARRRYIQLEAKRDDLGVDELLRRFEADADLDQLTRLNFADEDYELFIDFLDAGFLHHYSEGRSRLSYHAGNPGGSTFMQLAVGDGMLSVVSNMDIWASEQIGIFDHGYLLLGLVEASEVVVFLTGIRSASLLEMIWKNFYELVLVALLSLLVWIACRARRFGPVLSAQDEGRRSFMEHIHALGQFMWRKKQGGVLLQAVREDLWHVVRRRFPMNDGTSDTERLAPLVQHSGLDSQRLHQLMYGPAPDDELQFLNMVKSLQEIKKGL